MVDNLRNLPLENSRIEASGDEGKLRLSGSIEVDLTLDVGDDVEPASISGSLEKILRSWVRDAVRSAAEGGEEKESEVIERVADTAEARVFDALAALAAEDQAGEDDEEILQLEIVEDEPSADEIPTEKIGPDSDSDDFDDADELVFELPEFGGSSGVRGGSMSTPEAETREVSPLDPTPGSMPTIVVSPELASEGLVEDSDSRFFADVPVTTGVPEEHSHASIRVNDADETSTQVSSSRENLEATKPAHELPESSAALAEQVDGGLDSIFSVNDLVNMVEGASAFQVSELERETEPSLVLPSPKSELRKMGGLKRSSPPPMKEGTEGKGVSALERLQQRLRSRRDGTS